MHDMVHGGALYHMVQGGATYRTVRGGEGGISYSLRASGVEPCKEALCTFWRKPRSMVLSVVLPFADLR